MRGGCRPRRRGGVGVGVGEVAALGARASGHNGRSVIGWIEFDAGLPFGPGGQWALGDLWAFGLSRQVGPFLIRHWANFTSYQVLVLSKKKKNINQNSTEAIMFRLQIPLKKCSDFKSRKIPCFSLS